MVEASGNSELISKFINKPVFGTFLNMFDPEDKLYLRTLSKKLATEVDKTFREVTIELEDDEEDRKQCAKMVNGLKNLHRVTIMNFTMNDHNLDIIKTLVEANSNSIEYLHLAFEGAPVDAKVPEYVEQLKKINNLKSFELSIYEDGGSTAFFKHLNEEGSQGNFQWFSTVKTLRVYEIYEMADMAELRRFIGNFKDLDSLRTLVTEQFNPFEGDLKGRAIKQLQTTYSTDDNSKNKLLDYINNTEISYLAMCGGDLNNVDLTIAPPKALKRLRLKDMPNVNFDPFLEKIGEYDFEEFSLIRIDTITKEKWEGKIVPALEASTCLRKIRFEVNHENFTGCFPSLTHVCSKHVSNLEHLSLSKTPIKTQEIKDFVAALTGVGMPIALKVIDFTHVFNDEGFDFNECVREIASLSRPDFFVNVWISRYQVKEAADIQDFISEHNLNVTVVFDPKEIIPKPL